jgi:hypothetical protein
MGITDHMTSCSYSSLEQCKAMSAGIGGDCFRDPSLGNSSNTSNASNANAYASAPKQVHSKRVTRPIKNQ